MQDDIQKSSQRSDDAENQYPGNWPHFAEDEIEAVVRVLRSGKVNYWTGAEGRLFEQEFAHSSGCQYGIAVANGTVALELALRALNIGDGDEVITSSRTFIASASCIVAVGARPVFADVDACSQNITARSIRSVITSRTKAIIPVHLAGWPCEMNEIMELAREFNLKILEDCAQAQGATYSGRPVGSFGDVAAFSFCQDKIMTTAGEGGMVTTSSHELWERMWSYKDHGKCFDAVYAKQHPWGFRWLHESFGTNWRLTELQSALGRVTLAKVPQWLVLRRRNAEALYARLRHVRGLRIPQPPAHIGHAHYKFYAFVEPAELSTGWNRDRIAQAIAEKGIFCSVGSCSEVYMEKAFPAEWRPLQPLAVAQRLGETSLMFLVHPTLAPDYIELTCSAVEQVLAQAVAASPNTVTAAY